MNNNFQPQNGQPGFWYNGYFYTKWNDKFYFLDKNFNWMPADDSLTPELNNFWNF